jgi:hypothetical protein
VIACNPATFSITDGGLGDDDLMENGNIVDHGDPGAGGSVAHIPLSSEWALLALADLMGLFGGMGAYGYAQRGGYGRY